MPLFSFNMNLNEEIEYSDDVEEVMDGEVTLGYLATLLDLYGISFLQRCVSILYAVYLRITFFNLAVFLLKYVPTGLYSYKIIKNIYCTSRERLKQKQMELEDIQIQIQIVNTKLCVREAEYTERAELLRREAERLRRVRARVRDVIASDESLRRTLDAAAAYYSDLDVHVHATPQEDNEFINELLKSLKREPTTPELLLGKADRHEYPEGEAPAPDHVGLYSSLSDIDVRQDCHVKIVKVTNVYKVAYLKHYIKQKKLRRATKRAALKKKMETLEKMLDDWQKTLHMMINSKLTILNIDAHPIDVASQEAMGDYSKPHEPSDSDSDHRNDIYYDEYSLSWTQNPYRPYGYNYEEVSDTAVTREYYDQQDIGELKYSAHIQCEGIVKYPNMMSIVEETGSQMAIEEIACDNDDGDCRDLVAI